MWSQGEVVLYLAISLHKAGKVFTPSKLLSHVYRKGPNQYNFSGPSPSWFSALSDSSVLLLNPEKVDRRYARNYSFPTSYFRLSDALGLSPKEMIDGGSNINTKPAVQVVRR